MIVNDQYFYERQSKIVYNVVVELYCEIVILLSEALNNDEEHSFVIGLINEMRRELLNNILAIKQ